MTVCVCSYQAGLQHEGEEESMTSLGRPEIWIRTHPIQYRSVNAEAGGATAGPSSRGSASLPSSPFTFASATPTSGSSSSRKHAWSSSSGGRKRSTSAKLPPPPTSGAAPRVTRSTSARAAVSGTGGVPVPLPRTTKRSSSGGGAVARSNGGAEASPTPVPRSETVKEKEPVVLSPLHRALLDCVKAKPGEQRAFAVLV